MSGDGGAYAIPLGERVAFDVTSSRSTYTLIEFGSAVCAPNDASIFGRRAFTVPPRAGVTVCSVSALFLEPTGVIVCEGGPAPWEPFVLMATRLLFPS